MCWRSLVLRKRPTITTGNGSTRKTPTRSGKTWSWNCLRSTKAVTDTAGSAWRYRRLALSSTTRKCSASWTSWISHEENSSINCIINLTEEKLEPSPKTRWTSGFPRRTPSEIDDRRHGVQVHGRRKALFKSDHGSLQRRNHRGKHGKTADPRLRSGIAASGPADYREAGGLPDNYPFRSVMAIPAP